MTTSALEVGDLLSVLGAHGIERQLQRVAGVRRVSVNPVSGSTTVVYFMGLDISKIPLTGNGRLSE